MPTGQIVLQPVTKTIKNNHQAAAKYGAEDNKRINNLFIGPMTAKTKLIFKSMSLFDLSYSVMVATQVVALARADRTGFTWGSELVHISRPQPWPHPPCIWHTDY